MTNVTKIKDSAIDKFEILETLEELKSRLHFLCNALPPMLTGNVPSDEAVNGVVLVINDCCNAVTKVGDEINANIVTGGMA